MVFARQNLWRHNPAFQNLWQQAFPGLKYGALAFGVYWAGETVVNFVKRPKATPGKDAKAGAVGLARRMCAG